MAIYSSGSGMVALERRSEGPTGENTSTSSSSSGNGNKSSQNYDSNNNVGGGRCPASQAGVELSASPRNQPGLLSTSNELIQQVATTRSNSSSNSSSSSSSSTRDNINRRSDITTRRSERNLSESTTIDDWHLLEVDTTTEQSSLSPSSSSSVSPNDNSPEQPKVGTGELRAIKTSRTQSIKSSSSKDSNKMKGNNNNNNIINNNNNNNNSNNNNNVVHSATVLGSKCEFNVVEQRGREKFNRTLVLLCTGLYSLLPLASLLAFVSLICLLFTKLWFVTVIYYSYLLFDAKTCNRGGRRWQFVYRSPFWSYLAAYFPIRLKYSHEFRLSPSENYILNYHPHGISAFGCVSAFATNALNLSELFPGIISRFMVHETSFLVPVMRETFGLRGDCSVNSASFDYILSKKWKQETRKLSNGNAAAAAPADGAGGLRESACAGNLLALCGGGLAEADLSDMETLKIVCATRKGIIKKALIHGANLVPCIAFGENSVFKKVNLKPGSLMHTLESKWYQLFKFRHPIYYGTSLFGGSGTRGMMPYERPITVCMADPIKVERVEQPSQEEIDHLHSVYMDSLRALYEDNQGLCSEYDRKLEFL